MKAIDGNLRIDQSYVLAEIDYVDISCSCENCGKRITNVAIVTGSLDNAHYMIGLDCASTLVGITPDVIKQAQKQFKKIAKIRKSIRTEIKTCVVGKDGWVYLYTVDVNDWKSFWKYAVKWSAYKDLIELVNLKIVKSQVK